MTTPFPGNDTAAAFAHLLTVLRAAAPDTDVQIAAANVAAATALSGPNVAVAASSSVAWATQCAVMDVLQEYGLTLRRELGILHLATVRPYRFEGRVVTWPPTHIHSEAPASN